MLQIREDSVLLPFADLGEQRIFRMFLHQQSSTIAAEQSQTWMENISTGKREKWELELGIDIPLIGGIQVNTGIAVMPVDYLNTAPK